ncbi:CRGM2 protein, partial [Polypterus senegalus]
MPYWPPPVLSPAPSFFHPTSALTGGRRLLLWEPGWAPAASRQSVLATPQCGGSAAAHPKPSGVPVVFPSTSWCGGSAGLRYRGSYRMRIYERPDFGGQMMEFTDDCPNVYDRFRYNDIFSCNVMEGYWIFYEHANYRGRQYFLRPGEYRRFSDWGGFSSTIGSFRRMREGFM